MGPLGLHRLCHQERLTADNFFQLLYQSLSSRRFTYQFFKALEPRRFLFCTHYPPANCFSIRWWLSIKEIPCRLVFLKPSFVRRIEDNAPLFIRINARLIFFSRIKCSHARRFHQTFLAQFSCALDVDRAPNASSSPWRKSNHVAPITNALADSVDPAKTERFVHRFWPSDGRLS